MDSRDLISPEAEHGVLGALMIKPELCEHIGAMLSPLDFGYEDNGVLYSMMLSVHSKGIAPDVVSLSDVKSTLPSGELTMVYATEIAMKVPSAANGKHYAKIVLERSKARKLHELGMKLMEMAATHGSISEQIAQAQQFSMDLVSHDERPDVIYLSQAMLEVVDDMEARNLGQKKMGIDFGLSSLDKIVKGMRPGNLIIIAGRPGTGKTVLGLNAAENLSIKDNKETLIFSLEMSAKELAKRSVASISSIDQNDIDSGEAYDDQDAMHRMTAAASLIRHDRVRLCDKGALPLSRIASIARFENRAKRLDLIVIDYLGLISPEPGSKAANRNQEVGAISRGLKALAKELEIPIIVLCQLNRGIESRADAKPKMSDLRDSGEIEQDADVIVFAHRDNRTPHGEKGLTEIDVAKCRHAQPGFCLLQFQGQYARFVIPAAMAVEEYNRQKDTAADTNSSSRDYLK